MQIIHNLILILHFISSICQCILKYFVKYVEIFHGLSYFAYKNTAESDILFASHWRIKTKLE